MPRETVLEESAVAPTSTPRRLGQTESTRFGLRSLTDIEGIAEQLEISVGQRIGKSDRLVSTALEFGALVQGQRVRLVAGMTPVARTRHEVDVARPHTDRGLGDAQLVGDLDQGPRTSSQLARPLTFFDLAAVPHSTMMTAGYLGVRELTAPR